MDDSYPEIMGGLFLRYIERDITEICGLNYNKYLKNKLLLTKELLEKNVN